ncbi:hypothetical protein [Amycolatopsis australiensis]|uniref:Uncharacterized protein n=1 Tax=Amycolatopsis australiensis TaxID=546364 RepID=A0A1K1RIK2_9PSEU|nr:hypothetical protein [Amycolatopsis australiensis]SFW71668.1 hypothetical protein SAMN04489730_3315 [Amycolatopsis australiensis]
MGRGKKQKEAEGTILAGVVAVCSLWGFNAVDRRLVALASAILAVYCLCRMPAWCCADRTDGGRCEEPTAGVFSACWRPPHQERKRKLIRTRGYWTGLAQARYSGVRGAVSVYLATMATVSALVALIAAAAG